MEQLRDMGVSHEKAETALQQSGGDLHEAIAIIFNESSEVSRSEDIPSINDIDIELSEPLSIFTQPHLYKRENIPVLVVRDDLSPSNIAAPLTTILSEINIIKNLVYSNFDLVEYTQDWFKRSNNNSFYNTLALSLAFLSPLSFRGFISANITNFFETSSLDEVATNFYQEITNIDSKFDSIFDSSIRNDEDNQNVIEDHRIFSFPIDLENMGSNLYQSFKALLWDENISIKRVSPILTIQLFGDYGKKFSLDETFYPEIYTEKYLKFIQGLINRREHVTHERMILTNKILHNNVFEGKSIKNMLKQSIKHLRKIEEENKDKENNKDDSLFDDLDECLVEEEKSETGGVKDLPGLGEKDTEGLSLGKSKDQESKDLISFSESLNSEKVPLTDSSISDDKKNVYENSTKVSNPIKPSDDLQDLSEQIAKVGNDKTNELNKLSDEYSSLDLGNHENILRYIKSSNLKYPTKYHLIGVVVSALKFYYKKKSGDKGWYFIESLATGGDVVIDFATYKASFEDVHDYVYRNSDKTLHLIYEKSGFDVEEADELPLGLREFINRDNEEIEKIGQSGESDEGLSVDKSVILDSDETPESSSEEEKKLVDI